MAEAAESVAARNALSNWESLGQARTLCRRGNKPRNSKILVYDGVQGDAAYASSVAVAVEPGTAAAAAAAAAVETAASLPKD